MKKIIFMLLMVVNVGFVQAQCACCGSSSNLSAGELTPTSYALGKRQWMGEIYSDVRFFTPKSENMISDHLSQTTSTNVLNVSNMVIASAGLRYGINSKTSLLIQQPYIFINATPNSSKAFGDMLSLINFKAVEKNGFILGIQAGMEWPTGENIQANGNSISTGSGSFDPAGGLNIMKSFKNSSLRAGTFFKYTTKGFNNIYYGNFFGHQVGYNYFILNSNAQCMPDSLAKKTNASKVTLALNLQVSGEWLQPQMTGDVYIANTGYYAELAGAGFSLGYKGFTIPLLVTVPVYQYYHGSQNQNQFRVKIGISKLFN